MYVVPAMVLLLNDAQPSRVARSIVLTPRGARNEVLSSDRLTLAWMILNEYVGFFQVTYYCIDMKLLIPKTQVFLKMGATNR